MTVAMDRLTSARPGEKLQNIVSAIQHSGWKAPSLIAAVVGLALLRSWRRGKFSPSLNSAHKQRESSEPGLYKKHSSVESFTTASGYTYPQIRVFYHEHPQAAKLPKDIPLLVFIHGLGGNATQFAPLLTSFVNVAPCLAIDLPGCGLSAFKPDDPRAYTTMAFAELLVSAIDRYRDNASNQQVVLIGHSMGCSITALLSSSTSPLRERLRLDYIAGMISICPRSSPLSAQEIAMAGRLKWMPVRLFDIFRMIDRRGGINSHSITRLVGEGADVETRRLQQKFNAQSQSAPFLRILAGTLPSAEDATAGWPSKEIWTGVKVPLFLVAGEADKLTPPKEVTQIQDWLSQQSGELQTGADALAATEPEQYVKDLPSVGLAEVALDPSATEQGAPPGPTAAGDMELAQERLSKGDAASGNGRSITQVLSDDVIKDNHKSSKHGIVLKTTILPEPAAHGLMYATSSVRVLSGLMEGFLARHIDERLSLGWQLQHLTTSGKWDVKNLKKWRSVDPCSAPIGTVFRAMKTMREVDDTHNPREFVKHFSSRVLPDGVAAVVDISYESPVYNPQGLDQGGVEYHKFPTVSKLPPTAEEVDHFVSLIDRLRRTPTIQPKPSEGLYPTIGVHCHYGFNRTGFFMVCYLVERLGYRVQDAIEEFAEKRAPGVKHEHFVNELYVRYAVKLGRRGTIIR